MNNSKSKGLGKGLDDLFNNSAETSNASSNEQYSLIPLEDIEPNPLQPRKNIEQQDLEDLDHSIQEQGLLQPILVRSRSQSPPKYQIIAGERRYRACNKSNFDKIPAIVVNLNDTEAIIFGLIENLQREDLNPLEEAEAFS